MIPLTTLRYFYGFKQFFKERLNTYMLKNDTYPDIQGEGLFQRYMALFGESLDYEQARHIDDYLDIIDASITEEKYLTHLSDVLGNPPDVFKSVEQYRNLLSYITNVYKVKGTKRGYELFFYILGFTIEIKNLPATTIDLRYDSNFRYDSNQRYDPDDCMSCSFYDITIKKINTEEYTIDGNTLELLNNAIAFNEPINAKLRNFIITLSLEDTITLGDIIDDGIISTDIPVEAINCVTSDWSDWGPCLPNSTQVRTRTVITPAYAGGTECGPLQETRACQLPVNCTLSDWSDWGPCLPNSTQVRTRTILTPAIGGGTCDGPLEETRACQLPVDCQLSDWGPWSICTQGFKTRTRTIITPAIAGGIPCGPLTETEECTLLPLTEYWYIARYFEDDPAHPNANGIIDYKDEYDEIQVLEIWRNQGCTSLMASSITQVQNAIPCTPQAATGKCYSMTLDSETYFGMPSDLNIRFRTPGIGPVVRPLNQVQVVDNLDGTYSYYVCSEIPVTFKQDGQDIIWPGGNFGSGTGTCSTNASCTPLIP